MNFLLAGWLGPGSRSATGCHPGVHSAHPGQLGEIPVAAPSAPLGTCRRLACQDVRRRAGRHRRQAPVAQWIEQPPPKRKVASSTLAWGTTLNPLFSVATPTLTCAFATSLATSKPAQCGTLRHGL